MSREVEAFLYEVECKLLNYLYEMAKKDTRKPNKIANKTNSLMVQLQSRKYLVLVPTNKTNSVILMVTTVYSTMVTQHLAEHAKLTNIEYVRKVKVDAINQLEKNKPILLDQEYNYVKAQLTNLQFQPSNSW